MSQGAEEEKLTVVYKGKNGYLCYTEISSAFSLYDMQFSQKLRWINSVVVTVSEANKTQNKFLNISCFLKSKLFITVTSDPTIYDFLFFPLTGD